MKLQTVIRAAVCAVIVAICIAGAGWFKTRPVAGQETKEQILQGAAALDRLKQDGQYDSLQDAMNQARFSVSRAENTPLGRAAWHAPNPAAGYNAYVTEDGVSIALNNKTYVSLSLHSLGYGHAVRSVAPGAVSGDKQRINIAREDGVREWYINGPDGLEQGFTLSEPPGQQGQGAPLRLIMQVSKGWSAVASEDGMAVILRGPRDEAVEYSKLVVRDSLGRNIPARLAVADEQVVIEVEDSDGVYPLTIDPIFSFQQKLLTDDAEFYDYFGCAVAIDGDTLVAGAMYDNIGSNADQGSVYVFTRSGGVWSFQQKLFASDGLAYDYFGHAVAVDDDTLVVGDGYATIGENIGQGSVYVFTRNGGVWTFQQKLTAFDGGYFELFGFSVALDGDTLVAGAKNATIGGKIYQGSVYVFTRNDGVWTFQQKLFADDGDSPDHFGQAVALSGDTLVIGAHNDKIGTNYAQGSVYVFTRSNGFWSFQKKLTAADGSGQDFFGFAVALSGDTLVAGAKYDTIGANVKQGSVYVFTRNGGVWTFQQKLTDSEGGTLDYFGESVALNGDILVVGAWGDTIDDKIKQGSVHIFTRISATWTQHPRLTAYDGEQYDEYGFSVALSGDTLVVGARGDDTTTMHQGSVYVYTRPTCPTLTFAPASLPIGASGTSYQQQIAVSGGVGPYQFSLAGGALPPGLTLTNNGALSGILPAPGAYHFTVKATDMSSFCSSSHAYTITVAAPCSPITISPSTLPYGFYSEPYSATLTATGGVGPYTFTMKGMPPGFGLTLSADGVLSGAPGNAGTVYFTVFARDAYGCVGSRRYSITIYPMDFETGVAATVNGGSRRVVRSQPTVRRRRD